MRFPIFRRPGAIAFLDDDSAYLDMLGMVLPDRWHVELFMRSAHCINHIQQEPPKWEADAWRQQEIVDNWSNGVPLIPQILQYWAGSIERYALTQVCVVDYSMPGMDGLQVLAELMDWPGARVLLTGQADEHVAVTAFNRALIDQFIPTQIANVSGHLIDAVQALLDTPHPRHEQIWRSTLTASQCALLRVPSVGEGLATALSGRWVEHVVIGDPFGILGLDIHGQAGWLQLEPASGLADLAELAESQSLPASSTKAIREGELLVDLELRQCLGNAGAPRLHPAFSIGLDAALTGAFFAIDSADVASVIPAYKDWLDNLTARNVRD